METFLKMEIYFSEIPIYVNLREDRNRSVLWNLFFPWGVGLWYRCKEDVLSKGGNSSVVTWLINYERDTLNRLSKDELI